MDRDKFSVMLQEMFAEELKIGETKALEYTQTNDRLDNFKRIGAEVCCPHCQKPVGPFVVWWIYFKKHIDSVRRFVCAGDVLSEPIEGRIKDLRVYLSLLRGLVVEQKEIEAAARASDSPPVSEPAKPIILDQK